MSLIVMLAAAILIGIIPVKSKRMSVRKLLVIDTAYSYKAIEAKSKHEFILQRNLGGFFDTVYTLYPVLGANPFDGQDSFEGTIRFRKLSTKNILIEGKMASIKALTNFPRLNFLITQCNIIMKIRKLIITEDVSVLRGSDPFFTGLYCLLLARMTGRPFVLRIGANYDLMYEKNRVIVLKKLFRWYFVQKLIGWFVFPNAKLIFAANQSYLDYSLSNGARKERCVIARFGNIIDPIHFSDPSTRKVDKNKFQFVGRRFGVYVGRLSEIKLPKDLLLVAFEMKKHADLSDVSIVIIGDGEIRKDMEKMAREMNIEKSILFLGDCKQNEIAGILPYAVAYLAPHSGLSLVEAALAATPLIAYDYEWHPELVKPGITGELVPHRDWKKMAESFVGILRNPTYGKELGVKARLLALEMMDQKKIQAIEIENYSRLLNVGEYRNG
jgi:glycosyltransferase involved in cell wall biosynthesis